MVMQIVPVIDLMEGIVVHALKGERERYQPVQSILTSGADPVDVARCLQMATHCRELYIADLDAIQGNGHNTRAISEITSHVDADLWVDAGIADVASADRLISAGADIIIIGTETLTTLQELKRLRDAIAMDKLILSLDVVDRRVLSGAESLKGLEPLRALAHLVKEGLERFILLTLDAVGTGEGPDLSLLRRAKQSFPQITLIAGGGIKKPEHLRALSSANVDGVLVATSLHRGWITGHDIAALK